jgi:hypothetical protein
VAGFVVLTVLGLRERTPRTTTFFPSPVGAHRHLATSDPLEGATEDRLDGSALLLERARAGERIHDSAAAVCAPSGRRYSA